MFSCQDLQLYFCEYHFKKIVISPNNFKIVPIKIFTPLSQTGTYIYVFDNLMVIMGDEIFESGFFL